MTLGHFMDIFDLHCDTAFECERRKMDIDNGSTAVNLHTLSGRRWQCFAVFVPDKLRGAAALEHYCRVRDWLYRQCSLFPERIRLDSGSLNAADGRCTAVLTVENGAALGGDPERVFSLHRDGVRMMTLTWNGDNELASGSGGSGGGLTDAGRSAVENMRQCGMTVDVSHLGERGFYQLADMGVAVAASHSCLRSVHGHRRNLTDEQFAYIRDCGGVVGINFYSEFLGYGGDADAVYRHVSRALELGGENTLAIGSDYDGAEINEPLCSADCFEYLADYLSGRGLDDIIINKMFCGNAQRMFAGTLRRDTNDLQQHKKQ